MEAEISRGNCLYTPKSGPTQRSEDFFHPAYNPLRGPSKLTDCKKVAELVVADSDALHHFSI